jgi:hypothetical protein
MIIWTKTVFGSNFKPPSGWQIMPGSCEGNHNLPPSWKCEFDHSNFQTENDEKFGRFFVMTKFIPHDEIDQNFIDYADE